MLIKFIDLILLVGGMIIIVISSFFPQGKVNIDQNIGDTKSYYTSGQFELLALGVVMVAAGILVRIWIKNKVEN